MGKDEQKTVLLVTSFYLLFCSLKTHSASTDGGSNSSSVWEKWVHVPSSHLLSYLIIQGAGLFLALLVACLWRIASTLSIFWPVNTFDLSWQFKQIYVYTGMIKRRNCIRLDEMRLGIFHCVLTGNFTFNLIPNDKLMFLEWNDCQ